MTLKRPRYRAAQKYDIPQQSISDRLKGQVALADQIQPRQLLKNTVNVDEGGIMSGFGLDSLVVGSADPKRKALLKGPQSRNWTSFIEAITADGRVLTPGIIFKGKELQKQWFLTEFGKIADWHYITSPNGWTDNHIAIEWLERMDMEVMQRR
ncbi:DDE superfamily endonuclease [Hirsutella rhossiliensis]